MRSNFRLFILCLIGSGLYGISSGAEIPQSHNYYQQVAGLNEGGSGADPGTDGAYHQKRHCANYKLIDALGQPVIMGDSNRHPFSSDDEWRIYSGALPAALDLENSIPDGLECEGRENPLNVVNRQPGFSAVFRHFDPSARSGGYRIQVARDLQFSEIFWDSGEFGTAMTEIGTGERCGDMTYAGPPLRTDGRGYWWRIRFWDTADRPTAWSGPGYFFLLLSPKDFLYRREVSLANPGGELADYQIRVVVNTAALIAAGRLRSDCGDLRFVASDGVTPLSYWLESGADSAETVFWVRIPSLPAGESLIFLFYGNPDIEEAQSGSATFEFFDDFEDGLEKWTLHLNPGNISIVDGHLKILGTAHTILGSGPSYAGFGDGVIEGEIYLAASTIAEVSFRGDYSANTGYKSRMDTRANQGLGHLKPPYSGWSLLPAGCTQTAVVSGTWHSFKMTAVGSQFSISCAGREHTDSDGTYSGTGEISLQNHYGAYALFDNIRVRRYAAEEPTVLVGIELRRWEGEEDWRGSQLLAVDGDKVEEDLVGFPVLVRLGPQDDWSRFSSGGSDIRFVDSSGEWEFPHEIEYWEDGVEAALWVGCPLLSAGEVTYFRMYFDNPEAPSGTRPDGVWDGNYQAVWHQGDLAPDRIKDSTGRGNTGFKTGAGAPLENAGRVARGQVFNGTSDHIEAASGAGLNPAQLTLSAWVNPQGDNGGLNAVVQKWGDISNRRQYQIAVFQNKARFYVSTTGATWPAVDSSVAVPIGGWSYLAGTYDGSDMRVFVDGELSASTEVGGAVFASDLPLRIGGYGPDSEFSSNRHFPGIIDEVRLSNVPRSAAWIKAKYHGFLDELLGWYPTELEVEGENEPSGVLSLHPSFSAVFNSPYVGGWADKYRIQVSREEDFFAPVWETGEIGLPLAAVVGGERSQEIIYAGDLLHTDGTSYYWRIKFWDTTAGEEEWSLPSSFRMLDSVPDVPTDLLCAGESDPVGLTVIEPELCAVFNDREPGDSAVYYQVQAATDSGFGDPVWETGMAEMAGLLDGEVFCLEWEGDPLIFDGSEYFWRIRFWDLDENVGDWSEAASFTMADYDQGPSAPTGLLCRGEAAPVFRSYQAPYFSAVYNDLDGADQAVKYRVQVSEDPGFESVFWESGSAGTAMANLLSGERCGDISCGTDLPAGARYYWRIKFWDLQGLEGEWSEAASFTLVEGVAESANYVGLALGQTGGGCGNGGGEKRGDGTYRLVDSLGMGLVSSGSGGAPYLSDGGSNAYFEVLFAALDTIAPSIPGEPAAGESPTYQTRPAWEWADSLDNFGGSGLREVAGYRIWWSQLEGGEDYSAWVDSNSYTHQADLGLGLWYLKVRAADREGNLSGLSANGSVLIVTPSPTPSVTPTATPSPTASVTPTPSVTPTAVPTATPDGGCRIDLTVYLHGYLDETTLVQRPATVNVEFRTVQNQAGDYDFDLELDSAGRTGEEELWFLPPDNYYLLIRQKLSGETFTGEPVPLGANHYPAVSGQPREFIEGIVTTVNLADGADPDYLGVYVSDHPQASSPMLAVGTQGALWMLGGGNADGNDLINVADILKWDTLVGFPDADDRGEARFSEQGNFDGNAKIDGYDFNIWKRMVNEGVTYAPLP